MSSESPAVSRGWLGRLLRSRLFIVVASVAAVALVVSAVVVYVARADPFGMSAAMPSDQAPSAFPTTVAVTSAPVTTRGATVSLRIESLSPTTIDRLELWDGANLWYSDAHPAQSTVAGGRHRIVLSLDYVPLTAGLHWLSVRAFTARSTSVSAPHSIPVRDFMSAAASVGPATPVELHSGPGDSLGAIARRLGVDVADLAVPALAISGAPLSAATAVPEGTLVSTSLISAVLAKGLNPKTVHSTVPALIAAVEDCKTVVVITNANPGDDWALYATTPLKPGYQRIGDVGDNARFTTSSAPIGETSYIAYPLGTSASNVGTDHEPTAPVVATMPDSCASSGWTGNAKVLNGVLITDQSVQRPYAYVSVDQGAWTRVPAQQGTFLTAGTVNDIRSAVPVGKYDQFDVQVWDYENGFAQQVANGTFCRATMTNPDPADSSGSGGKCQPAGATAKKQNPNSRTVTAVTLSATTTAQQVIDIPSGPPTDSTVYGDDPTISREYRLTSDVPITFTTTANGNDLSGTQLQLSYFPIGTDSVSSDPPGVFNQQGMQQTSGPGQNFAASVTLHPWQWNDTKVDLANPFADLGSSDPLSLDDQISIDIANQRIAAGKDLLDTIYVRAVSYSGPDHQPTGAVSPTIKIDLGNDQKHVTLPDPTITVDPGVDLRVNRSDVLRNSCLTVAQYPPQTPPLTVDDIHNHNQSKVMAYFNYQTAIGKFPDPNALYCLDSDYQYEQTMDAQKEADEGCSLGCFLTAIIIGVAVGAFTGGVGGALIGAAIAAGLTAISGQIVAGLEQELEDLWDSIASAYNAAYQAVVSLVTALNPVCLGVKAFAGAKSGAAAVCDAVSDAITSAAISAVTGLPPSIPMSSAVKAIAAGDLGAIAYDLVDAGLTELGLSCSVFAIPADESSAVQTIGANSGEDGAALTAAVTDPQTGEISGCAAISNLVTSVTTQSLETNYAQIWSGVYSTPLPPGLLVNSVADSTPTVVVSVPASATAPSATTCPVTMNLVYHQRIATGTGKLLYFVKYNFWPIESTLTKNTATPLAGAPAVGTWTGRISIPVYLNISPLASQVKNPDGTKESSSPGMFEVAVDSPCFTKTYTLTLGGEAPNDAPRASYVLDAPTDVIPYH